LIELSVSAGINFNDESLLVTGKIRKVRSNRCLPTKVCTLDRELPQIPPELFLRVGHVAA
jgi:hypothetical protein